MLTLIQAYPPLGVVPHSPYADAGLCCFEFFTELIEKKIERVIIVIDANDKTSLELLERGIILRDIYLITG